VQNFSFVDEISDRTGDVFDGDNRVDAVPVEKIDAIRAEAFEGFVSHLLDLIGPAVETAFTSVSTRGW
jgi:hypothetical protein